MGDSRLSARFGADTTDFKSGITEINREIRVVESGFRASAAALGDWSESATGLEQRMGALNSLIALQDEKVGALTVQYEQIAAAQGANSVAAQNAEIALNKEIEKLNKMKSELGDTTGALEEMQTSSEDATPAVEDLGASVEEMQTGSEDATPAVEDLGATVEDAGVQAEDSGQAFTGFGTVVIDLVDLAKLGAEAISGMAQSVIGLGQDLAGMVFDAAGASAELVDLSVKTGVSTTRLQELAYVGDQLGTSQETITSSMARLTRSMASGTEQVSTYHTQMADAIENSGRFNIAVTNAYKALSNGTVNDSSKAFAALGVELLDVNGNLLSAETIYQSTMAALESMGATAVTTAASSNIFGVGITSALEFNDKVPVLGDAAAAFETLGVSVTDASGNLRDNEAVFADTLDALGAIPNEAERDAIAMSLFGKSAQELNPLITAGAEEMAALSAQAHEVGAVMSEDAVQGLADFQDSWDSLQAGLTGMAGELAAMVLPAFQEFTDVALGGLRGFVDAFTDSGGDLSKTGELIGGPFGELVTQLGGSLPGAVATVANLWRGTLMPALMALWTWLSTNVPAAIRTVSGVWTNTLQPAIMAVWGWISTNLLPLFETLGEWLGTFLPIYLQTAALYWSEVLQPAIVAIWGWISNNLLPVIQSLFDWLNANLPGALQTVSDFFVNVLQPAIQVVGDWITATLIPTLTTLWDWLSTNIPPVIQGLADLWNLTLLPALKTVWEWISLNLVPLFEKIGELFSVTLTLAITALAGLWETTLLPALEKVWTFLSENVFPIFEKIGNYLGETLGPKITEISDGALKTLRDIFGEINQAIQDAIKWIDEMITKIKGVQLPPWMGGGGTVGTGGTGGGNDTTPDNGRDSVGHGFQPGQGLQTIVVTVIIQGGTEMEKVAAKAGVLEAARKVGWA